MNATIADYIVMVLFGVLVGVLLKLFASISALDRATEPTTEQARRRLRERLTDAVNPEKVRAENRALMKSLPRSAWLAMIFIYGLIAMLVVVVKLSPITMRWWPFLGSVFGGYMIAGLVFRRAAAASRRKVNLPG